MHHALLDRVGGGVTSRRIMHRWERVCAAHQQLTTARSVALLTLYGNQCIFCQWNTKIFVRVSSTNNNVVHLLIRRKTGNRHVCTSVFTAIVVHLFVTAVNIILQTNFYVVVCIIDAAVHQDRRSDSMFLICCRR